MNPLLLEKRSFPRIVVDAPIVILDQNALACHVIDISENGMRFISDKYLLPLIYSADISMPNMVLNVDFEVMWSKPLAEKGKFLHGARFRHIKSGQRSVLKEALFSIQVKDLLSLVACDEHKEKIRQFFVSDIRAFTRNLSKINKEILDKRSYDTDLEKRLTALNSDILVKADALERSFDSKIITKKIRYNFRFLVSSWIYKSQILKMAALRHVGYPEEHKLLELIYDHKVCSEDVGMYFDKSFVNSQCAAAVRIRKDRIKSLLKKIIDTSKAPSLKILNIACGSCREIVELLNAVHKKSLDITCVDQDADAIEFSQNAIKGAPENTKFKFFRQDLLKLIRDEKTLDMFEKQDLVYTIGLMDYMPDRIFRRWIHLFYRLLADNGKILITHRNGLKKFQLLPTDWFCGWRAVRRDSQNIINLISGSGLGEYSVSVEADEFNYTLYFTLTKHG